MVPAWHSTEDTKIRIQVRHTSRYLHQKSWILCKPRKENRFARWSQGWRAKVVKDNVHQVFINLIYFSQDVKNNKTKIAPECVSNNHPSLRKSVRLQWLSVSTALCIGAIMLLGVLWRWTSRGGTRGKSKSGLLSCFKTRSALGLENSDASSRDEAVQKWSELKFSHRFGILGRDDSCICGPDLWIIIKSAICLGNRTVKRRTAAEKTVVGQECQAATFRVLTHCRCGQLWANHVLFSHLYQLML